MQASTAAVLICPLCLVLHEFPSGHFPISGSAEASLPLEKEEQVRLQARKRLEEQLKQYRVKRQQERVSPALGQPNGELLWSRRGQPDVMLRSMVYFSVLLWKGHFSHWFPPSGIFQQGLGSHPVWFSFP